jgi:hypothetical protein
MKLKLKNTPEQVELIKKIGSKNGLEAAEALETLAAFVGPIIQKVLSQAGTASYIYKDMEYNEDDSPSYPLDLYYNENAGLVSVWSQNAAGGLPTNYIDQPVQELKINTYRLDSAVSFSKKYARKARLDVVSGALDRMAQEVLIKQEKNAWAVILKALMNATTLNGRSAAYYDSTAEAANGLRHLIRGNGTTFTLQDLNDLMVRIKRINVSFANGTPSDYSAKGLTDLFVSPEIKAQIRAFSFNPIFPTSGVGQSQLPNDVRQQIFNAAGMETLFGVGITELIELGVGQKYNSLAAAFQGSHTGYAKLDGSTSAAAFAPSTTQILVGLDLSRDCFIRPVSTSAESNGQFSVLPDDQFVSRAEKTGFYGFLEEGRIAIDSRAIAGLII